MPDQLVVIGLDVGTTAVKVGLYGPDGTEHAVTSRGYPLHSPHPGWAEQDPDHIVAATMEALAEIAGRARQAGISVAGIAVSTPMHTLIGLAADGSPLTPMSTYADTRAHQQAARLRAGHLDVYRRTGTPLHPMSPLAKLIWFAETEPQLASRVAYWVTIKEYLLGALTGVAVIDQASASATGLFDLARQDWDSEALELAGINHDQLAPLVSSDHRVGRLTAATVARTGLSGSTVVIAGATDGVLANLGVGALGSGVGAVTIGTSGAVRVTVDAPVTDPAMRVFCYALTRDRWVVGGAINNGGLVLRWLRESIFDDQLDDDGLTDLASAVPPGSDGVIMLPYLTGERAPQWSADPSGVFFGLRIQHGRGQLVRAGLEGVAHQLRLVTDALAEAGHPVRVLRATGGFTHSPLWLQIVADILDVELELPEVSEATACGAAFVGLVALGLIDRLDDVQHLTTVRERIRPDPANRSMYEATHRHYAELTNQLADLFHSAE